MSLIVCDIQSCKWNSGKFCNNPVVPHINGVCQIPFDKNGRVKDYNRWKGFYNQPENDSQQEE